MLGEDRLELDERGDIVEGSGTPVAVVDLLGPVGIELQDRVALDGWVVHVLAAPLRRHRMTLVAAACAVLVAAIAWVFGFGRVASSPILTLTDARANGGTVGGAGLTPDGHLTVGYLATAAPEAGRVEILGLQGPGLGHTAVEGRAASQVPADGGLVRFAATLNCSDNALESATPTSYSVAVRATTVDRFGRRSAQSLQALDSSATPLDAEVRDACLEGDLTQRLSIASAQLSGSTGSPLVGLVLRLRNDSDLALTVTTMRTANTTIETDQSTAVLLAPHSSTRVTTRLLVHDCALFSVPTLSGLRDPVSTPGSSLGTRTGLTFRVGLGAQSRITSYPLPWSAGELRAKIEATACAGHPELTAHLLDVHGSLTQDGGWVVSGTFDAVTTGIGISLEREHFTGPATEQGSQLATTDSLAPDVPWALTPVQLGGGAGRLPVTLSGPRCDERDRNVPTSLPVWVTASDRYVYPFEWQLDPAQLLRAADAACAAAAVVRDPSTGAVVIPYVPS